MSNPTGGDIRADLRRLIPHFNIMDEFIDKSIIIDRAEGAHFWDINGKKYLDGVSGVFVVNIGYGNRRVISKIKEQLEKVTYNCLIYSTNTAALELIEKLSTVTPKGINGFFFVSGGSEAVESAIKISRQYHLHSGFPNKYRVISRWISYHGATIGALSATGHPPRRDPFEPLLLKFPHIPPAYCYRCPFRKKYPECDVECARKLETVIRTEGADSISAFIAEPIVGLTGGAIAPPKEYFPIVREICDKYNVHLILDEVITGFGRTGKMFALEHWDVKPDIITVGKGMASGYSPIAAAIVKEEIIEELRASGDFISHGHTFGGHPVSCAAASACLDVILNDGLVDNSARMGEYLMKRLRELNHKIIGDVRGRGLLVGVELVRDKEKKSIFPPDLEVGKMVADEALKRGVKIFGLKGADSGLISDFLTLGPPLIVNREHIDRIVEVVDESLRVVEERLSL